MQSAWKKLLKVGVAVVVPGAAIYLIAKSILNEAEKQQFREYIRKTYGRETKDADF